MPSYLAYEIYIHLSCILLELKQYLKIHQENLSRQSNSVSTISNTRKYLIDVTIVSKLDHDLQLLQFYIHWIIVLAEEDLDLIGKDLCNTRVLMFSVSSHGKFESGQSPWRSKAA